MQHVRTLGDIRRLESVARLHQDQLSQAHKANIDYKIGKYLVPETVKFQWREEDYHPA